MSHKSGLVLIGFLLAMALAPGASAQSAITGIVSDTSGAVLPGVSVEVASPALIEQTRTAVTDASGAYRVTDLRPGTYKVSFTLAGFNTFIRDGLVLESEFTATVNAQMKIGGLEESITVSGQSPVVDVASTMQRTVLSQEQIESLPTGRSYQSLAATIPALAPAGLRPLRRGRVVADVAGDRGRLWLAGQRHLPRSRRHERDVAAQFRFDLRRLSQSGRLPGDVLSGCGGVCRVADRWRPHQHDPEGRRQPVLRRLPGAVFERALPVREPRRPNCVRRG